MTAALSAVDLDAAAASLRGYGAPDLPRQVIADGITADPDIVTVAREHGWADGEVVDRLWATVCVRVLDIGFTEQLGRFLSHPQELAADVEATLVARADDIREAIHDATPCDRWYCPTSGEVECGVHGGFDVCCDRTDLHQPIFTEYDYRPAGQRRE